MPRKRPPRSDDDPATAARAGAAHVRSRVLKGVLWFGSATVVRAMLRLVVMAVLARLLFPADFGLIGAAGIFIALVDLFSTSGVIFSIVQRRGIEPRHVHTAFTVSGLTGLFGGAVLWLLAEPIAGFFAMPLLAPILAVLALLFPLNALSAISQKLLERELAYGKLAAIEVASYFFGYALVAMWFAWAGHGAWALVYATIGAAAVRLALLLWLQPHSVRLRIDRRSYSELMASGAGFTFARYASYAAQKGDYFVIGRWLGATQLGLYERAYVLMDLSNSLLTNALGTILFPAFARLQDDKKALAATFERVSAILALVFMPAGLAASVLAPEIIAVLLGDKWDAAVAPFRLLALGMFFRTAFKISSILAHGVGAPYRNAKYQAIYAALVIAGALATYRFGITAVAGSTLFALAVTYVLLTRHALEITGIGWARLLRDYLPAVRLTLVAAIVIAPLAWLLRGAESSPLLSLSLTGGAMLAIMLLLARFAPRFYGPHGQWILAMAGARLSRRAAATGGA